MILLLFPVIWLFFTQSNNLSELQAHRNHVTMFSSIISKMCLGGSNKTKYSKEVLCSELLENMDN